MNLTAVSNSLDYDFSCRQSTLLGPSGASSRLIKKVPPFS